MFEYDAEKNLLTIQKVKNIDVDLDLLRDQKESYQRYVTKTVYEDMDFLLEEIKKKKGIQDLTITTVVKPLFQGRFKRDVKKLGNSYYPVEITLKHGIRTAGPFVALKIPYLDDFCKLNIDGRRKVIINEQRPAEDISYDSKKKVLNITVPSANISIFVTPKGIKVKYMGNKKCDMDLLVRASLYENGIKLTDECGVEVSLPQYFSNDYLLSTIQSNPYFNDELNASNITKTSILQNFASDQYVLGETRDALNSFLNIDACLMETLSRPAGGYKVGTKITQSIMMDLKRKRVNEVYVEAMPHIDGMYLYNEKPLAYNHFPAGTKNCKILAERFPQYKHLAYLKEDITLDPMDPIFIEDGARLTKDDIEFLYIMGEKQITCRRTKSGEGVTYRFEREIVGNCTARLSDLVDVIPDDRRADEWVYYYNNPTLEPVDDTHLTPHDLLAIMSLLARIYTTGDNPLLNRDTSYLKKVNMINETFSENFRKTVPSYITTYSRAIDTMLVGQNTKNPFFMLTRMWIRNMQGARLLAEADTVNVAAEVTQVSHVSTVVESSNSVAEEMRHLAIPFYGRLCPYETPAGKKLGLVNTKAIGAHVQGNKLVTPYRRVKKTSAGITISNKVEYLSVKDEMHYKIGDILSLKQDGNGKYLNTKVIARIPNPELNGDKVIFGEVNSFELDYVNAHTEQHLSPTAALMPFACSNDAVRVSFGLNMLRQCIYIQHSEVPVVKTFMYDDIFRYSNTFLIKAKKSGMVVSIEANSMLLLYDDGEEEEVDVPETRITNDSVTFLNYRVAEGERFSTGEILVDSCVSREGCFTPARNVLLAYISTGWNYEDAIEASEAASAKYVSIANNSVERLLPRSAKTSVTIGSANKFRYIDEGEVITNLSTLDNNDKDRQRKEPIRAIHESGIFYDTDKLIEDNGDITYRCYLLGFNKLQRGDKMAGRHGNKGVVSRVTPNSHMPVLANGRHIELIVNPCGVPSRMNMGQIYEGHLGLAAYVLGIKTESDPFNGASAQDIKLLMNYAYDMANSKDSADAVRLQKNYPMLQDSLHKRVISNLANIWDWAGCFTPWGDAKLWDPVTETYFENEVTIGYSYFLKLVHEADHKLHVRAGMLEEQYNQVNKQPPKGARKGGGQRMGEMELCAVAAYGAQAFLHEIMNEKSDNAGARANIHLKALGYDVRVNDEYCVPRAVEALLYKLEAVGVHTEIDTNELPDFGLKNSMSKFTYDVRTIIRNRVKDSNNDPKQSNDDLLDAIRKKVNGGD